MVQGARPARQSVDPSSAEPSPVPPHTEPPPLRRRVRRWLVGRPRSVEDPGVFHHVSLVAFLAWVGLGADGLSSSAYGPEEAFKALGVARRPRGLPRPGHGLTVFDHRLRVQPDHRAVPLRWGRLRGRHPLLGPARRRRLRSALMVDYVLTITTSMAAAPTPSSASSRRPCTAGSSRWSSWRSRVLVVLNLRGVQGVGHGARAHLPRLPRHPRRAHRRRRWSAGSTRRARSPSRCSGGFSSGVATLGIGGMLALFLRAYSMGGGDVHRHRGGLQRARRSCASRRWRRQAHDGADGDLARPHRGRHHPRVSPIAREPGDRARR